MPGTRSFTRGCAECRSHALLAACGSSSLYPLHKGGDGLPDLTRGVLLDEVRALDRYLLLILPRPAELASGAGEDHARIRIDEQLWYLAPCRPPRVALYYLRDVLGFAVDGYLPGQERVGVVIPR